MEIVWILLSVLAGIVGVILLAAFVCFMLAFYAPKRRPIGKNEYPIPPGNIYLIHRDRMVAWMKETRAASHTDMSVTSFDGLTLRGKYYEYAPGAPVELMIHGYRGTAERDLCGGVQRAFALGHNVLTVDQRASGFSDGHIITFGIRESRDCLTWIEHIRATFGSETKIYLTGISMGAATVLTAVGRGLPDNVCGILADCGYSTSRDIIKKVIRQLHLPAALLYPLVRLGARLYGGFDPEEISPLDAMKQCRIPVIFFHGDADDYVPCDMSRENYETCTAEKCLVIVPGAGHGLAYLVDPSTYIEALRDFWI